MSAALTVADSKREFHRAFPHVIAPLYRRMVDELLVELHLLSRQTGFRSDALFACGLIQVFDSFAKGYRPDAQRLPLLTRAGWVHAGILGSLLWGCLGLRGWLAVVIYLAMGSLVTRLGFRTKQVQGLAEARGGREGGPWRKVVVQAVADTYDLLEAGPWNTASSDPHLARFVAIGRGLKGTRGAELVREFEEMVMGRGER